MVVIVVISIHRRRRGVAWRGCSPPPQLSRNLLHSVNFPERTIGNLGSFSDFALLIWAELLQPSKFLVFLRLCTYIPRSLRRLN